MANTEEITCPQCRSRLRIYKNGVPPPPPPGKMSLMKFWSGSDYSLCRSLGCTHIQSFLQHLVDHEAAWRAGLKTLFILKEQGSALRARVRELKTKPYCGGYHPELFSEPDLRGSSTGKAERLARYRIIREEDPDREARPSVVVFDMTEYWDQPYKGWSGQFSTEDHDILVIDDYCYHKHRNPEEELEKGWRLIQKYEDLGRNRVMPALQVFWGEPPNQEPFIQPDVWHQYEYWKTKLGTKSMAFYSWWDDYPHTVHNNSWLQGEVRRVNEDIFR